MICKPFEPKCNWMQYKERHLMLNLINFIVFEKYTLILNLMPTARVKEIGTGACLPFLHHLFLLPTLSRYLGKEDTDCWSFKRGIQSHSCYMWLQLLDRLSRSMVVFRLIIQHTFSTGDRSVLQAGQFSAYTLLLQSHTVVGRQNMAWHCPAGINGEVLEKDVLWMAAYAVPKPGCIFQH